MALDAFHDDQGLVVFVSAKSVDGDDIGVLEIARDIGFLEQAQGGLLGGFVVGCLDGDFPGQVELSGQMDLPHAAGAKEGEEVEVER